MKYEAGNRFNPDTYIKTEVDSASVTVKVYGELEGVEVDFNSGDIPEITSLSVTENGTYEALEGTAYDQVTVEVPNTYTAEDAGKVVVEGALVSQTSTTKTANGTYDTTTNNEVVVEVPNTYTAADEGKVVSSGALVSQTSRTVTANDTYDTTTNNEVVVAVPGPSGSINITQNGTVDVTNYASAVVNVSGSLINMGNLMGYGELPDEDITITYDSSKSLRTYAFWLMKFPYNTRKVTLTEGHTALPERFFQNSNPRYIDLPSTLTDIAGSCFVNVSNGTDENCSITCRATTPPTLASGPFTNAHIDAIYVPAESVEAYKAASVWSLKASIIQAIPTP